ncbi:ABC transporter substrate-binding protein [Occultella kanbiaonis]|uniref:ABC transporter substrate-binding protein n=1 Tax=Occultella kanbiaonis TaxID=2675754 RepID=UPI0012B89974|nr:ABC transporter substrate-binding protein [Occultella kanbiaonis]
MRPDSTLRRIAKPLTAAIAAALLVSACAESANTADAATDEETSITILQADIGMGLIKEAGANNTEFLGATQATLVRKPYAESAQDGVFEQDPFTYEGYLAESYEVSDDGLVYTFHLSDAVSAAGNELTADDVLWSFELKFGAETSTAPGAMSPVITDPATQFTKIDDKTVSITIASPGLGTTLLSMLADALAFVYDSSEMQANVSDDDPYAIAWAQENPNYGFGPYEITDWEVGSFARFEARDNWILGTPGVDVVNVQVVPDAGSRASTIRAGDADIVEGLSPTDAADLASVDTLIVPTVSSPNTSQVLSLVTNKAPFDNLLVRQAISQTVPFDDIIANVYQNRAVRNGSGIVFTNTPGYDATGLPEYDYDPESARELLAEAGYPDGLSFTLTVSAADAESQATAVQIQTAARPAGFDIVIETVPGADFHTGRYAKIWQALLSVQAPWALTPIYTLNLLTGVDSQNNMSDWEDPEFYEALAASAEVIDQSSAEAGAAWNVAETRLLEEVPFIQIAQVQPGIAISERIAGYAWRTDNTVDYAHLSINE